MTRAVTACLLLLLAAPAGLAWPAGAPEHCADTRDRALERLDDTALAVATAFDTDAAIAGAAEFELLEAKEALLEDIGRERQEVLESYRRCAGGGG
jgi:hypothetical protein